MSGDSEEGCVEAMERYKGGVWGDWGIGSGGIRFFENTLIGSDGRGSGVR